MRHLVQQLNWSICFILISVCLSSPSSLVSGDLQVDPSYDSSGNDTVSNRLPKIKTVSTLKSNLQIASHSAKNTDKSTNINEDLADFVRSHTTAVNNINATTTFVNFISAIVAKPHNAKENFDNYLSATKANAHSTIPTQAVIIQDSIEINSTKNYAYPVEKTDKNVVTSDTSIPMLTSSWDGMTSMNGYFEPTIVVDTNENNTVRTAANNVDPANAEVSEVQNISNLTSTPSVANKVIATESSAHNGTDIWFEPTKPDKITTNEVCNEDVTISTVNANETLILGNPKELQDSMKLVISRQNPEKIGHTENNISDTKLNVKRENKYKTDDALLKNVEEIKEIRDVIVATTLERGGTTRIEEKREEVKVKIGHDRKSLSTASDALVTSNIAADRDNCSVRENLDETSTILSKKMFHTTNSVQIQNESVKPQSKGSENAKSMQENTNCFMNSSMDDFHTEENKKESKSVEKKNTSYTQITQTEAGSKLRTEDSADKRIHLPNDDIFKFRNISVIVRNMLQEDSNVMDSVLVTTNTVGEGNKYTNELAKDYRESDKHNEQEPNNHEKNTDVQISGKDDKAIRKSHLGYIGSGKFRKKSTIDRISHNHNLVSNPHYNHNTKGAQKSLTFKRNKISSNLIKKSNTRAPTNKIENTAFVRTDACNAQTDHFRRISDPHIDFLHKSQKGTLLKNNVQELMRPKTNDFGDQSSTLIFQYEGTSDAQPSTKPVSDFIKKSNTSAMRDSKFMTSLGEIFNNRIVTGRFKSVEFFPRPTFKISKTTTTDKVRHSNVWNGTEMMGSYTGKQNHENVVHTNDTRDEPVFQDSSKNISEEKCVKQDSPKNIRDLIKMSNTEASRRTMKSEYKTKAKQSTVKNYPERTVFDLLNVDHRGNFRHTKTKPVDDELFQLLTVNKQLSENSFLDTILKEQDLEQDLVADYWKREKSNVEKDTKNHNITERLVSSPNATNIANLHSIQEIKKKLFTRYNAKDIRNSELNKYTRKMNQLPYLNTTNQSLKTIFDTDSFQQNKFMDQFKTYFTHLNNTTESLLERYDATNNESFQLDKIKKEIKNLLIDIHKTEENLLLKSNATDRENFHKSIQEMSKYIDDMDSMDQNQDDSISEADTVDVSIDGKNASFGDYSVEEYIQELNQKGQPDQSREKTSKKPVQFIFGATTLTISSRNKHAPIRNFKASMVDSKKFQEIEKTHVKSILDNILSGHADKFKYKQSLVASRKNKLRFNNTIAKIHTPIREDAPYSTYDDATQHGDEATTGQLPMSKIYKPRNRKPTEKIEVSTEENEETLETVDTLDALKGAFTNAVEKLDNLRLLDHLYGAWQSVMKTPQHVLGFTERLVKMF